jgi:hypothetical protein
MDRRSFLGGLAAAAALPSTLAYADVTATPYATLDAIGSEVSLVEPNGRVRWQTGGLNRASHAIVDARGQVWVADRGNHRVLVLSGGRVRRELTAVAGRTLHHPRGLDTRGDRVAFADPAGHRVILVDLDGRVVGVLGSLDGELPLNFPVDVAWDDAGRLHVLQAGAARVDILDATGVVGSYGEAAGFVTPRVLHLEGGQAHVLDRATHRYVTFDL